MRALLIALLLGFAFPAWAEESAEATTIPVAAKITDRYGAEWTQRLSDRAVLKAGRETGIKDILEVWYLNHEVWAWTGIDWLRYAERWEPKLRSVKPALPTAAGLRVPTGPQKDVPCEGVKLTPADNITDAVANHPEGTTFCFAVGTYKRAYAQVKKGNVFIGAFDGANGAVFDGDGYTWHALFDLEGKASHVTIRNLFFRNYASPTQDAPIVIWAPYLLFQQNDVGGGTQGAGVWASSYALVIGNRIHHNAQEGFKVVHDGSGAAPAVGVTFDSNEIAHNNPSNGYWDSGEQGGGKAWNTQYLTFWYNDSHDNNGPGFWTDYDNIDTLYWYNKSSYNTHGIEHEISYNASIIGNELVQNGGHDTHSACPGWYFTCGAVSIENSGGVNGGVIEIAHNRIVPGKYGRALAYREQNRGSGQYGPWLVRNVYAHHNMIDLSQGLKEAQVGAVQDRGDNAIFTDGSIRFGYNEYVGAASHHFTWLNNGWMSWDQWLAHGHDAHSTDTAPASPDCPCPPDSRR
jgi:hypothetical protein